jgi:hypothetical protein
LFYYVYLAKNVDTHTSWSIDVYSGAEFDLGKNGAFKEFTILVGNFFRHTKELSREIFMRKCGRTLETTKGFRVIWSESEEEFIKTLDENAAIDSAWVISGDALDWAIRLGRKPTIDDWNRLASAVERFDL